MVDIYQHGGAVVLSNTQEYLLDVANLITLPDIYIAVKEAIEDPDVSLKDLADIVSFDPAISTRLLKVANSSFYGQVSEIDTIKRAVSLLGTKTVHDTALTVSVSQAFRSIVGVNYDVAAFWQNSIMRAVVAKSCAAELKIPEPDRFFILGLLSDIGHMVMSIRAPDLMQKVLTQHHNTGYPIHLYERSTFGFDYGELGADLLEGWSIPNSIISGIRYQNCPEIAPEFKQEAAVIYCAGRLHPDEKLFPNLVDVETLKQSNIDQFDYDHVRNEAKSLFDEALCLLPAPQLKQVV
jgi:HD-like signal output (HDOD) protein